MNSSTAPSLRLVPALLALAGLIASAPAASQALALEPIDSVVAVVEEDVILRSELDRAVANIVTQYADRQDQLPPREVLEKQVLERLVLVRLQTSRAADAGMRVSDIEVDNATRSIAQQNNITIDQLRQQLARDGMDYREFQQTLRDEMIMQRLRQSIVQSRVSVSDTEVDIALASDDVQTGRVRVSNILVAVPDGADAATIETARTKIEGVKALLDRGEMDFAAAAIRYSDAPNALDGGDLGWRSYDEVPAMFTSMLRGMEKGQISEPVRGPSGFHMIRLVDTDDESGNTVTEYKTRHIMIRFNEIVSSDEALARIDRIKDRLEAGESFEDLAREFSEDTRTSSLGGDLGWAQPNTLGQSLGEVAVALEDGEVSEPFLSEGGWHILQRLETREQDVTEQVRRNRAREMLGRRKADEEYERFLRQLRDEAYIEMRLDA